MPINKIYIIILIFAIIILFLIIFLVYPALKEIENNSKEILSNKDKVVFTDAEFKELDNFIKKHKDYKSDLEKIDKLFIDSKNPVNFIEFLETISYNSNVSSSINLVSSAGDQNINGLPVAVFQISAKADILNILKLIKKIETGPYLIRIQNLTIKKSEQDNIKGENLSNRVDAIFLIEVATK